MALTKVTYSMIEGAVVNVLDYGATGDGTTDDTAAIQSAIDSLTGRKGEIYFPVGNYLVSTLTVTSNITFRGVASNGVAAAGSRITGSGSSTLIQASAGDKASGWYNFNVFDLVLWGAGVDSGNGLNLDGCSNFNIERVYIQNFLGASKIGLYVHKPTNSAGYFTIKDCYILYNTHNLRIYNVNSGYVTGGRIANATTGGYNFDIQGCYSIMVSNIAFEGTSTNDILAYAYANNEITFANCYFEKGYIQDQNNVGIYFINPHLNTNNTVYKQGGSTNSSSNRVVMDATGFGGGMSQNLLANGHFSYWNNTTLIGWSLASATVAAGSGSEITNSYICQATSSSTSGYIRQIIRNEKKFLDNGRFKVGIRVAGDSGGTIEFSLKVSAHSPTNGSTQLMTYTSSGASYRIYEMDIDVAAYAAQTGTYNDIDYVTVDFYPNTSANGTSATAYIDWIVLTDGLVLASPIPPNTETYIYYASPDASPTLASNSEISGKFYYNVGTGKLRIYNGTSFVTLN